MSGEEDFLTRWSRRKREAEGAKVAPPNAHVRDADVAPQHQLPPQNVETAEAEFDPASLPPIDSINALTDLTAFLRAGVPAELTRAALRRVWTADPAIRNFVGLAENAWDFTDPNAMPGFGPLESTGEVRRMIAGIVDRMGETVERAAREAALDSPGTVQTTSNSSAIKPPHGDQPEPGQAEAGTVESPETIAQNAGMEVLVQCDKENIAPQDDVAEASAGTKSLLRRTHGRALPR